MTTIAARKIIRQQQTLLRPPVPPPPPDTDELLLYDLHTPIAQQNESWTCSVYSGDWVLRSLGLPSDDETLEREMVERGVVNSTHGLLDARGYGLADVLRGPALGHPRRPYHLPPGTHVEVNPAVEWEWLRDRAGLSPIALGGRAWNHWVGVREAVGDRLTLANPADGHKGVFQRLSPINFELLGPWSAVRVDLPATSAPWQFWGASRISQVTQSPFDSIRFSWPLIYNELAERGIADLAVCAAAIATTAIETASTFDPVREAYWVGETPEEAEEWRRRNLRYYPYYGRGFIQLTWNGPDPSVPGSRPILNYTAYGDATGYDLANNPDLALEHHVAAAVMAEYFLRRGVADAARRHDWTAVRRNVQGATAGLDRLLRIVGALGLPV